MHTEVTKQVGSFGLKSSAWFQHFHEEHEIYELYELLNAKDRERRR